MGTIIIYIFVAVRRFKYIGKPLEHHLSPKKYSVSVSHCIYYLVYPSTAVFTGEPIFLEGKRELENRIRPSGKKARCFCSVSMFPGPKIGVKEEVRADSRP